MLPYIPSKSLITKENSCVGHSKAAAVTSRILAFKLVQHEMLARRILVFHIHIFFLGEPWTSLRSLDKDERIAGVTGLSP